MTDPLVLAIGYLSAAVAAVLLVSCFLEAVLTALAKDKAQDKGKQP